MVVREGCEVWVGAEVVGLHGVCRDGGGGGEENEA